MKQRVVSRSSSASTDDRPGFFDGSFTSDAGTLTYSLHRPAGLPSRPPLVVMLHGCSQSASDFALGTRMNERADEAGVLVLYPEQSTRAHPLSCWNWYETAHQSCGEGEPALIAGATRQVIDQLDAEPQQVYIAGMSAGGSMAAVVASSYPDLYAAVGIHSGVATGEAASFITAFLTMRNGPSSYIADGDAGGKKIPTIVFHGDGDNTVHPGHATAIHARTRHGCMNTDDPSLTAGLREVTSIIGDRSVSKSIQLPSSGAPASELWMIHGAGHAWSGGNAQGSLTDTSGPDASREMLRFFLTQRLNTASQHA